VKNEKFNGSLPLEGKGVGVIAQKGNKRDSKERFKEIQDHSVHREHSSVSINGIHVTKVSVMDGSVDAPFSLSVFPL
jgi:hypothetical protein